LAVQESIEAQEELENGGLPGWAWAVIGVSIGLVVLGAFLAIRQIGM